MCISGYMKFKPGRDGETILLNLEIPWKSLKVLKQLGSGAKN